MFNQRGQAFSVFELMIAAVVAIAILFVLLPIVSNINTSGASSAKDSIVNVLSTYKNGGAGSSTSFVLHKGDILSSTDFSEKGFDRHSVIFAVAPDLEALNVFDFGEGSSTDLSQVQYNGATTFNAKAQIYCQVTGQLLQDTIDNFGVEYSPTISGGGMCEEDTYQPCCLVIIKRA